MLYSFDIFDTLITRRTATPKGIFSLVEERLQNENSLLADKIGRDFYRIRVQAEMTARWLFCRGDVEDITLSQIYDMVRTICPISVNEAEYIKQLELAAEYDNSIAIEVNIKKLKDLIQDGKKAVLISDMYLDSNNIRKLLVKHDEIFEKIPIYVSSEYKVSKSSTNLYRKVRGIERVKWADWEHFGDNIESDYKIPGRLGMKVQLYEFPELLEVEKELLKNREADSVLQLYAGTARNVRITRGTASPVKLGTAYGAMILLQYVLWVLKQSRELGIKALYFVARDGWILIKIAELLKDYGLEEIEFKYLYGSRLAWITNGEISGEIEDTSEYLKTDSELDLLKKYFVQEIDLKADKIGFVEIHGRGTTQKCLGKLLENLTDAGLFSFYYFLDEDQSEDGQIFYRFSGNNKDTRCVIEILTRALHGRTIGYEDVSGIIKPVLIDDENVLIYDYGYDKYVQSLEECVSSYLEGLKLNDISFDKGRYGEDFFDFLVNNETGDVFTYICDIPLSNTLKGEEHILRFAPKPSEEEIAKVAETGWLNITTWCPSFSRRRLSEEEVQSIEINKEKYRENRKPDHNYVISAEKLKHRIVLYGAGKVGKSLYRYISDNNLAEIVAWTDSSFQENNGIFVTVDELKRIDFDQIIIAVRSEIIADDIKLDLLMDGFDEYMIFWESYKTED